MDAKRRNTAAKDRAIREVLDAQDDILDASHRLRLARDAMDRAYAGDGQLVTESSDSQGPEAAVQT